MRPSNSRAASDLLHDFAYLGPDPFSHIHSSLPLLQLRGRSDQYRVGNSGDVHGLSDRNGDNEHKVDESG